MNANDEIINFHAEDHDMILEDPEDMETVYEDVPQQEERSKKESPISNSKDFNYNLDLSKINIFYSDIAMPEEFLKGVPAQFQYKMMTGTLEQIEAKIKADIDDPTPKYMILQCWGRQLRQRSNQSVMDAVYRLVNLVDEHGIHKIAPSTTHFIPAKPGSWQAAAHHNAEMRIINIDRSLPPVTLHKALMDREFVDHGPLFIKGYMWEEFNKKEGLGETLSKAGFKKQKHFIMKAFEHQFRDQERKASKRYIGTPQPPPLSVTPGYHDNDAMLEILFEEGFISARGYYSKKALLITNEEPVKVPDPAPKAPEAIPAPKATPVPVEKPKTWYGQELQISEGGARRKVSLQNDSGIFEDSQNERFFNQEQEFEIPDDMETQIRRRNISYNELEKSYYSMRNEKDRDESYYKNKIDELIMRKEDLKDENDKLKDEVDRLNKKVTKLSLEVETLTLSEDCHKTSLKSVQKHLDAKKDELKLKDDKIKILEEQYSFVKTLNNDMQEMFVDRPDKQDKKKKRKD